MLMCLIVLFFMHCTGSVTENNKTANELASKNNSTSNLISSAKNSQNGDDAQNGYDISIQFKNLKNMECYLGHHFGDKQFVIDTANIDAKGKVNFNTEDDVIGGLYLVILPTKKYFEFILNEPKLDITTDTLDFLGATKFKKSKENTVFYEDLRFLEVKKKDAKVLTDQLSKLDVNDKIASQPLKDKLSVLDKEVKAYRADIIEKNGDLFYIKMLKATPDPEVPDPPKNADGSIDSMFQFNYYKKNYLKEVDFTDARMLNTPLLHSKMKQYFDQLTLQRPDSIVKSAFYIIDELVKDDQDVFKYVVNYVTSTYEKSKIMGMDEVFVKMVNKYYSTGRAYWIDDTQLYKIKDRAYKMAPLLLGKKAPAMNLKDKNGNFVNMYDIDKDVTILYFWDPDCGHCKKMTPFLKAFWDKYKNESITIYAACTEVEKEKWLKYINNNELDFINVGDFELRNTFREDYDIYSTPVVYLLDKDKIIKAKKIGVEQLDQVYQDYKAGKIK